MKEEIKRIPYSASFWIAFFVSLLTFLGYSLPYWIASAEEWIEYRESALHLSVGGIFFGGFILLFPFLSTLAYSVNQVDEMRSSVLQWRAMRSSIRKYTAVRAISAMLGAVGATVIPFVFHALLWNVIALPIDPTKYPNHTIYFASECLFSHLYCVYYGLPMYLEMVIGMAFTASVWAVVALAVASWVPDRLLTVAIPSFVYYLWNANVAFYFFNVKIPRPATLFNDGLTLNSAGAVLVLYIIILLVSYFVYYMGCARRCRCV